ncbi:MAG TPA: hypothetical protein VFJ91_05655 [Gaiellaceae bacterium]|nr:hypothetical protein [Gaiellaceae bacterium]
MHTAHAVAAHAVLVPLVLAVLAAVVATALRLRVSGPGHLGDPLDLDLVRRWEARR